MIRIDSNQFFIGITLLTALFAESEPLSTICGALCIFIILIDIL